MARRKSPPATTQTTAITSVETDRVLVRGYAIDELMGRVSFGDAIYLLLTGELPPPSISRLIGAMLTGFIDHGVTPTALVSRQASQAGASLSTAVATGILGFDRHHVGGGLACRRLLEQALDRGGSSMLLASAASELVEELVQADRIPPPGFGQQSETPDPRVRRLLQMALELEVEALYTQCLRSMELALERHPALEDERLPINVDGAIAAVSADLGLGVDTAEALLIISRVPGLVAHALEARQPDHRSAATIEYDGPTERRLRDRR